jgi:hypothetical protein
MRKPAKETYDSLKVVINNILQKLRNVYAFWLYWNAVLL